MEFLSNHIDDVGTGSITTVSLPLTQTPYVSSPITNTSVIRENDSLYVGGSEMDEWSLSSVESEDNDNDDEDKENHSKYIQAMSEAANVATQASILIFDNLQTDDEEEMP
jgi:sugar (pentulose or hexulose) kinase